MGYSPKKVKRRAHNHALRMFATLSVMGCEFKEHWWGGVSVLGNGPGPGVSAPFYQYSVTTPDRGTTWWAWSPRQAILKACKKLGVK